MLTKLLGLKGYEVLSAENDPEAVDIARACFPDMILLDLQLPKLDGAGCNQEPAASSKAQEDSDNHRHWP
jgi:CheY-like chemotaxis protein